MMTLFEGRKRRFQSLYTKRGATSDENDEHEKVSSEMPSFPSSLQILLVIFLPFSSCPDQLTLI
jgi:hypothetical protein